ncbi:MAG: hypothetical protein U0903_01450 [Planctomycetales bacterium]
MRSWAWLAVCLGWLNVAAAGELAELTKTTETLLKGCRVTARDGTVLYTPDGKGNYKALWTRDFAYMVENAGDLMPAEDIERAIRYLLKGVREDGAAPDRVNPEGKAIYVAGGEQNPLGEPNLDNGPFLVIAVDEYLKRLSPEQSRKLFREWSPTLAKGMDYLPRSPRGLIENDPAKPHSPYGFTDTVGKTGELLFESLLYWTASRRLRDRHLALEERERAAKYQKRSTLIEEHLDLLWDEKRGAFYAATKDCHQIDVWGNAYALAIGFPVRHKQERIVKFLADNYERYAYRGQVRHLLVGEYWERLLTKVPHDRYQNGAYWGTASGWVMTALAEKHRPLVERMWREVNEDYRDRGVCECITADYRQLPSYVVSATNVLAAGRKLGLGK